jgi:tRNA (guanine6-N2)-methyltransferase
MSPSATPAQYYIHTLPGLETIAWTEIHARFPDTTLVDTRVVPERNGMAIFSYGGDTAPLLRLRTAEDLFVLVERLPRIAWGYEGVSQIYEHLAASRALPAALALRERLAPQPSPRRPVRATSHRGGRPSTGPAPRQVTFRVISRLSGRNQPYRRADLEKAVVTGIERGTRKRWHAVQEGEEVEIWATLMGLDFVCGLRLSDAEMRHRPYQTEHLPAALRPSAAAAMAWLTGPEPEDVYLDPMCGTGTLLIERDAFGAHGPLLGGDLDARALAAAAANIGPRYKPRQLFRWDARRLPLADGVVDKVATNLPFGVQIGDPRDNPALYDGVLGELDRVLKPAGRAVLLTSAATLLRNTIRRHDGLQIDHGYPVNVLGREAMIYVLGRPR